LVSSPSFSLRGPRAGLKEQRCRHKRRACRNAPRRLLSPALRWRFGHSARNKEVVGERPPLRFGPSGATRSARGSGSLSGRDRRGLKRKRHVMNDEVVPQPFDAPDHEGQSPSSHLLDELALHGYRPLDDEPDPRPLPSSDAASLALETAVEALSGLFLDSRLEADLPDLLWSFVNLFHRKADRIDRELDDNETAQRRSQAEQDGSEIRSVELERLIAQGLTLTERRNAFEFFRDHLAELFATETGSAWRPRSGSKVNHRALTAAMIDSRDFLNAKKLAETQVLLPRGHRIAFAGGVDCNDHQRIWDALDRVHAKHSDMVLLHGGGSKGAERIASCWADNRKVPQVAFKPDWSRHKNAAPFKRNDVMLETLPIGVIVFPGSGIVENLADKARKMGIPVWKFAKEGG